MDIIYVLVSNDKDTYLEQTILSIESLKAIMKDSTVYVLIDQGTEQTLAGKRKKLYFVADQVITAIVPDEYDNKNRSRYLKTTMYKHMENDFLYIDGDTIICDDLAEVAGDYDIAAVLDLHVPISIHPYKDQINRWAAGCGFHPGFEDKHFNGGFMWVRKSEKSESFFNQWYALWKEALTCGMTQDQPSLNEVNFRMNGVIHELEGIWNCQMQRFGTEMEYFNRAKMIHYFASNGIGNIPYDLSNDELLRHALDDTYPDELQIILERPKDALRSIKYMIANQETVNLIESQTFRNLKKFYFKHRVLYSGLNKFLISYDALLRKIKTIIKKLIRRA